MRVRFLFLSLLVLLSPSLQAQSHSIEVLSPDGNLILMIESSADGDFNYSLSYKGKAVLEPSGIGFRLSKPNEHLDTFSIVGQSRKTVDQTWEPVWGEVAEIRDHHNELKVELEDDSGIRLNIVFRVFNDGLGFRYEFPEQDLLDHFIIGEEFTHFDLADDHTAFWIPGDYDTNEYLYSTTRLSEINALIPLNEEKDIAVTAPIGANFVQTPLMMKSDDGLYINIHEAALMNYSTMYLGLDKVSMTFMTHLAPDAVGNKVYLATPAVTPWRTVLISDDARDLITSKTILNLNEPNRLEDTDWITPQKFIGVWWEMHVGKGTWEYSSGKHAANTENVKKYIDFAAEHGFDGVLVEGWNEGWEDWFGNWKEDVFDFVTPYPDYDIEYLTEYAAERGVKIIMHHETSGSVTNYERRMDDAYQFMVDHNINTVKTGYVGKIIPRGEHHDGQWMNRHYVRVAEKAAEYKIMIMPHEQSRPTGLHRTFPNWMASEAARGNEFNNAPTLGISPEHQTILPFTRLIGGPMDFTPGLFHFKLNQFDSTRTTEVRTTLAKQLALYVTMYSPIQMAGDLPENYNKHLDALTFIKEVAVDWDDTVVLEAEPGDYLTIARKEKNSDNWFVGGITDEHARRSSIKLDFLDRDKVYTATIYRDAPDAHWDTNPATYEIEKRKVRSETVLNINLAPGGGYAISFISEE